MGVDVCGHPTCTHARGYGDILQQQKVDFMVYGYLHTSLNKILAIPTSSLQILPSIEKKLVLCLRFGFSRYSKCKLI